MFLKLINIKKCFYSGTMVFLMDSYGILTAHNQGLKLRINFLDISFFNTCITTANLLQPALHYCYLKNHLVLNHLYQQ